jgi:hypothetical protein
MKSPAAGGGGARNADGEAIGAEGGHIDRLAARIKATEPLQPLLAQRRWVMWRYEARNGGGKPSKAPYVAADPNRHASSKEPRDWCDFETAITAAKRYGLDGVSFALTPTVATTKPGTFTPTATTWIAAFDCDDCRDPKTGALAPWAQNLIEEAQSYVEITPSGIGLRIIGYGRADPAVHNKLKAPGGGSCEIYRQSPKFIAVTGDALDGWNRELANLDAAIDNHRRTTPQAPDRDGGEDRSADYSHRSGDTPGWILDLVRKTDAQDRSKEFFKVIRALKQRGWNSAEIEALFADNIDGIASKYWNRLRQEVDRAFGKPDHEADEGFGSFGSGQGEGANGPDDGHDDDALSDAEFAAAIQKLAATDCAAYERARIAASEALGIRVSALDKLVAAKRPPTEAGPGQGKALEISTPEPWDSPVNGASLLDEIEGLVRRFVVCDKHAAVAMALWIALTWFEEAAQIAPILNFKLLGGL